MTYLESIGKGALSNLKLLEVLEIEECPKLEIIDENAIVNMVNYLCIFQS